MRNVVVTVSFASRMHDPRIYGDWAAELVDHAIGTAYVARLLAEKAGIDLEEAFMCGLMHDIGKLVILKLAHDHARKTGKPIPPEEVQSAVDDRHAAFGGMTLKRWKLPEPLIEPVDVPSRLHEAQTVRRKPRSLRRQPALAPLRLRLRGGRPQPARRPRGEIPRPRRIWLATADDRAPGLYEVARKVLS